jgi:EmrB/QacA subfamily drug resistance transporter
MTDTRQRETHVSTSELRRERLIAGVVAASVFVSVLNTSMVNVALPAIGDALDADTARLGWLVTVYPLTLGISTPFWGRLGDRHGLRRVYIVGLIVFTVASLLAGLAPAFGPLVAFRALQGVGSAAIPGLGLGIVARAVPWERRGRAIGLTSMAVGAGTALGPTLGGALAEFLSWRAIFAICAGIGVLIPLVTRYLPTDEPGKDDPVDWLGGLGLAGAMAGALLGMSVAQRQGIESPLAVASFAAATLALMLMVWRQRSSPYPFIDPALIGNRRFRYLCAIGFLTMAANVSTLVLAPLLLSRVNDASSGEIGLALLPAALAIAVLSRTAGRLADQHDALRLITLGISIALAALIVMALVGVGQPVGVVALILTGFGLGQAFINSPLSTTLTRTVRREIYGIALGLYNMLFFVGASFGAALSTALLSSREDAAGALLPIYSGAAEYSEFGDAYLVPVAALAVALLVAWRARASRVSSEVELAHSG